MKRGSESIRSVWIFGNFYLFTEFIALTPERIGKIKEIGDVWMDSLRVNFVSLIVDGYKILRCLFVFVLLVVSSSYVIPVIHHFIEGYFRIEWVCQFRVFIPLEALDWVWTLLRLPENWNRKKCEIHCELAWHQRHENRYLIERMWMFSSWCWRKREISLISFRRKHETKTVHQIILRS